MTASLKSKPVAIALLFWICISSAIAASGVNASEGKNDVDTKAFNCAIKFLNKDEAGDSYAQ